MIIAKSWFRTAVGHIQAHFPVRSSHFTLEKRHDFFNDHFLGWRHDGDLWPAVGGRGRAERRKAKVLKRGTPEDTTRIGARLKEPDI